jgi:hypothetical protein
MKLPVYERKGNAIVAIRHKSRHTEVSPCLAHASDHPFSHERCMKGTNDCVPHSTTNSEDVIGFQLVLV